MIYLDSAATTRVDPLVLEAMMPYLTDEFGNAGSTHQPGRHARDAVERARSQVASLIGARPEQVVFTSGGTEANNLALFAAAAYLRANGRASAAVSPTEHESTIRAAEALRDPFGFCVRPAPINREGVVTRDVLELDSAAHPDPGLLSAMAVNNETGAVSPTPDVGAWCRQHGVLFHTDCVQAAGFLWIDADRFQCDFLSVSSHKIHGPKGVGALYIRDPEICRPMIRGGAFQEFGLRGGTENVPGIVGFGEACNLASLRLEHQFEMAEQQNRAFRDALRAEMHRRGVLDRLVFTLPNQRSGRICSFRIHGVDAETLVLLLDAQGICVSAGSACRSLEQQPSPALLAIGLTPEEARSTIRVSFGDAVDDEVIRAASVIAACAAALIRSAAAHESVEA